ncbi:hypothetical protein OND84_004242 [Morganella morganii]|nr:hypothetical protein [Morganella morganii]EMB6212844.1 hypothetical protein [Morganella morganii]
MNIQKLFAVKKPCANCPFRKTGGIPLTEGRLEGIKRTLLSSDQEVFFCHKTTYQGDAEDREEGQYHPSGRESYCMGAMAWLYANGRLNLATRLGIIYQVVNEDELKKVQSQIDKSIP